MYDYIFLSPVGVEEGVSFKALNHVYNDQAAKFCS